MRIYREAAVLLCVLLLAACSSMRVTAVSSAEANFTPSNATFDVYPLDFSKAATAEFRALSEFVSQEVSKKGMRRVNAELQAPDFLLLFDYAAGVGIDAAYERRFAAVMFDTRLRRIVHRVTVSSNGDSRNPIDFVPPIARYVYNEFPSASGLSVVDIPDK